MPQKSPLHKMQTLLTTNSIATFDMGQANLRSRTDWLNSCLLTAGQHLLLSCSALSLCVLTCYFISPAIDAKVPRCTCLTFFQHEHSMLNTPLHYTRGKCILSCIPCRNSADSAQTLCTQIVPCIARAVIRWAKRKAVQSLLHPALIRQLCSGVC